MICNEPGVGPTDGRPEHLAQNEARTVAVRGLVIGGRELTLWCGPCAIESRQQISDTAGFLAGYGVHILRGGAFKPRTSPYSFQGLGEPALSWLAEAAARFKLVTVSEVLDTRLVELVASYVDILQVGARNMHNTALLREVGRAHHPVLLKRGIGSTVEECLLAAEYILQAGTRQVILCERGIRTFEPWTRNTLDLSAVPLLKQSAGLPVIVDLSHSLGRTDIVAWMARAALAAGADGIMCEVHPNPAAAKSDGRQSLTFAQFERLRMAIQPVKALMEAERAAGERRSRRPAL